MTHMVIAREPCRSWLHALRENDPETLDRISEAITHLQQEGPGLGTPLVRHITGSLSNLKELRPPSPGNTEMRLLFAFGPERDIVLLVGGDKRGKWLSWYEESIPIAEDSYRDYLDEREAA